MCVCTRYNPLQNQKIGIRNLSNLFLQQQYQANLFLFNFHFSTEAANRHFSVVIFHFSVDGSIFMTQSP